MIVGYQLILIVILLCVRVPVPHREVLTSCLAHTEAVIDFGDDDREDDVSDAAMNALVPKIRRLKAELETHLQDGRRGEIVREGVHIALAGPPNAGTEL
jgi:tRNA modification GTPase